MSHKVAEVMKVRVRMRVSMRVRMRVEGGG